jgi:hypothetical protein
MGAKSEADIRRQLVEKQAEIAALLKAGKQKEAFQKLAGEAKKGTSGILELYYSGVRIIDHPYYKQVRKLVDSMFDTLEPIAERRGVYPIRGLVEFEDEDYQISLYQGTVVAGSFNDKSKDIEPSLKAWFVLGFYGFWYEVAAKALISYTNALTTRHYDKSGVVVPLLAVKYKLKEIQLLFDPFLRNSIDHSQYIVTGEKYDEIDAWEVKKGRKTPKKSFQVTAVFEMTVKLLFFVIAYHARWYEEVTRLAPK